MAAGYGPEGERLFARQTSRTLEHNRRLRQELSSDARLIEILAPNGAFIHGVPAVPARYSRHNWIIERTIRGLHFHHCTHILGDKVNIRLFWHTEPPTVPNLTWATGSMGRDQFVYKYFLLAEQPLASLWLFQFFKRLWASGTVLPKQK